jgi:hypothetical protein
MPLVYDPNGHETETTLELEDGSDLPTFFSFSNTTFHIAGQDDPNYADLQGAKLYSLVYTVSKSGYPDLFT